MSRFHGIPLNFNHNTMRRISLLARRRQRCRKAQSNDLMASQMPIRNFSGSSCILSRSRFLATSKPLGSSTDMLYNDHSFSRYTINNASRHHRLCLSMSMQMSMSTSTVASVSCWVKDVLRTKRLSPPNPILESLPTPEEAFDGIEPNSNNHQQPKLKLSSLPKFSILQPHHLQKAAEEISRQHDVELAQLEVRWTSVSDDESESGSVGANPKPNSLSSLLLDIDRLTAPVAQLRQVAELYQTLASTPDRIDDWTKASESVDSRKTKKFVEDLYRSRIVYRALANAITESRAQTTRAPSFLVPFLKRGAHIRIDIDTVESGDSGLKTEIENIQQIQNELMVLNDRLGNVVSYDRASKAMRLQCMSDMYNCIGLSRLQAQSILPGNQNSVWELAKLQHHHMVDSPQEELMDSLFPEIASSLERFLPKQAKLDLEGVGAFLEGKSEIGNSINSGTIDGARESQKARFDFKQRVRLHGVLKGFVDFCNQILGIVVVEDTEANNGEAGWSKNVRLLHLYEKAQDVFEEDVDAKAAYLGTIYFDPFADSYWRTDDAKDLVKTQQFSQQSTGQTTAPIVIVALKITPIWDDTPVPMTWRDTRDLLYQLGSAIQLILDQSRQRRNYHANDHTTIEASPIDTSDFLAHFLELWLQNDGFLHRLTQLSQEKLALDDDTIEILRKDLRNEKALELTNTMFLSALQFTVFESFDPRGDETLVSLQERLAVQHLPGSNLPDPSDLSPLLAIFQESGTEQYMSAHGTLWSEVLAATVYERFQKTDLRDRNEVRRLGTGIRDLFLRGNNGKPFSRGDIANLCKQTVDSIGSGGPLNRVYGFETKAE